MTPQPNQFVLELYTTEQFRELIENEAVECSEIAQILQDTAGGQGRQICINPGPGTEGLVRFPTNLGPATGNFHVVYADDFFVYDPRYRPSAIPIAEWEEIVNVLNQNANVFGR